MAVARPSHGEPFAAGETLGPYRLEAYLGEGRMGVVYRAVHPDGHTVALKVLREELSQDAVYRRRFVREARAAREVHHSHLVGVLDSGEAGGRQYLAVGYVDGRSLEEEIRVSGPGAVRDVVALAVEIGAGLDALHRADLVHRDVKPSNIMLTVARRAVLTDFGLAKGRAYSALTRPGQVVGSLDYLAPELIEGGAATPASDVYGLGCTVYEYLTGKPPFAGKSVFQVAVAHLEEDPPNPADMREECSSELGWAVLQALEKQPERRPPTATAYGRLLDAAARREAR